MPATVFLGASPAFACTGGLFQDVRYVDGVSWIGWNSQPSWPPGGSGQVTTAGVGSGTSFGIHVDVSNSEGIWDNVEYEVGPQAGTWQGWAQPTQPPGTVKWVTDAAEPDGSMQMIAVTTTGLYHDIRYANGLWQGWGEPVQPPVDLQDLGMYPVMAGMADGSMVTIIGAPGGAYYADDRYGNGTWSGWSQIPDPPTGIIYDLAIAGNQSDQLQVMFLTANDGTSTIYSNVWNGPPSGNWEGWTEPAQPPDVNYARVVTAAQTPDDGNTQDNTQFLVMENNPNVNGGWGELYGNIRIFNGSWQGWQQIATPDGVLDGLQGVPIAAPTWTEIGASNVWAEAPTFCPA